MCLLQRGIAKVLTAVSGPTSNTPGRVDLLDRVRDSTRWKSPAISSRAPEMVANRASGRLRVPISLFCTGAEYFHLYRSTDATLAAIPKKVVRNRYKTS